MKMLTLAPGEIHLWFVFYNEIQDRNVLDAYRRILNEEELRQQQRFVFAADRHRYLVTRALVRTVLSRYATTKPEHWRFASNAYGRPGIVSGDEDINPIRFNISHTSGLILLGVVRDLELGVDTENLKRKRASVDIADHFFSPFEASALRTLPEDRQPEHFLHYWTLKESYIKARGMGLSIPLEQFGFTFPDEDRIRFSIDTCLQDDPQHWRFWLLSLAPNYVASVCVKQTAGLSNSFVMRKTVPLESEEPFECALLRQSEAMQDNEPVLLTS